VAKLVARLLVMASLKNTKWATEAKEWPKHSSRHKKKKIFLKPMSPQKQERGCKEIQEELASDNFALMMSEYCEGRRTI
jgi:hypothetical protein